MDPRATLLWQTDSIVSAKWGRLLRASGEAKTVSHFNTIGNFCCLNAARMGKVCVVSSGHSKAAPDTLNQCFGTLCGQFCSAPFDTCICAILTLWLDLPESQRATALPPIRSFRLRWLVFMWPVWLTEWPPARHLLNAMHIPLTRIGPLGFAG